MPAAFNVRVRGQKRVFQRLNPNKSFYNTRRAVEATGKKLVKDIRRDAPVDTGNLKKSITGGMQPTLLKKFTYLIIIDAAVPRRGGRVNYAWVIEGLIPVQPPDPTNRRSFLGVSVKRRNLGREIAADRGRTYKSGDLIYFRRTLGGSKTKTNVAKPFIRPAVKRIRSEFRTRVVTGVRRDLIRK